MIIQCKESEKKKKKKEALPEQPHLVFQTGHMERQSTGQTGVEKNFTPKYLFYRILFVVLIRKNKTMYS